LHASTKSSLARLMQQHASPCRVMDKHKSWSKLG
jgi:hypothetical protein